MARLGTYQIMREFADEDKYFGLTKRQLAWAVPSIVLSCVVSYLFYKIHFIVGAIVLVILILGFAAVMAFIPMPRSKYLLGGGNFIQTLFFRILIRRSRNNRVIYVKDYELEEEDE